MAVSPPLLHPAFIGGAAVDHESPRNTDLYIQQLIASLDSLVDGEAAASMLVRCGQPAVPPLSQFLLTGRPRTIALPRCRAVRALEELGAYSTLLAYFREYEPPADAEVLFAEDAVRSAVAQSLLSWKSEEVFRTLLEAGRQRVTNGLILALAEFKRPESVPLFFAALEDDLCREAAKEGLRKVPEVAREYAILSIRGRTESDLFELPARRRKRATVQLLSEFGVTRDEWADLRDFIHEQDPAILVAVSQLGFRVAPESEYPEIVQALFRASIEANWAQEDDIIQLLEAHRDLACQAGWILVWERRARGERPNWLVPFWRILRHVLGRQLEEI